MSLLDVCMDKSWFVVRGIPYMMGGFGKDASAAGETKARTGNLPRRVGLA